MGSFLQQPAANRLLSWGQPLVYRYAITVAKATSSFPPSVSFNFALTGIADSAFPVPLSAVNEITETATHKTYIFEYDLSDLIAQKYDNFAAFTVTNFVPIPNAVLFVELRATDYLPNAAGLLSPTPSATASDIVVLNSLLPDVARFRFGDVLQPYDLMTQGARAHKIARAAKFNVFAYRNTAINAMRLTLKATELGDVFHTGIVSITGAEGVIPISLNTTDIVGYTFVDGDIPDIPTQARILQVELGEWDAIADEFTLKSDVRIFELIELSCNHLPVEFQNAFGVTDTVYFDMYEEQTQITTKTYKSTNGTRKLYGDGDRFVTAEKQCYTQDEYNLFYDIAKSGAVQCVIDNVTHYVVNNESVQYTSKKAKKLDISFNFTLQKKILTFNN